MATLLTGPDMFGPGPFGTHAYTASMADASGSLRRPASPPQPVPRPRQQQPPASAMYPCDASDHWADATQVSGSPIGSDATEHFLDCHSDAPSVASSYEADGVCYLDEAMGRTHPQLSVSETLAAAAAAVAASGGAQEERRRRLAAESAAAQMRQQLDDMSALLFSFQRQQQQQQGGAGAAAAAGAAAEAAAGAAAGAAAEAAAAAADAAALAEAPSRHLVLLLQRVLQDAAAARQRAEQEATQQRCSAAEAIAAAQAAAAAATAAVEEAADGAATVARMVAGMLARAVTAADVGDGWQAERALLERRLEQAQRMGEAMLKHQRQNCAEPEPYSQQLLNAAVSVGCFVLGAAAAVLIIRRSHSG